MTENTNQAKESGKAHNHSFRQEMGMDLNGVVVKSRTIPIIVLLAVILYFISDWVGDYNISYSVELEVYSTSSEIPDNGKSVIYISSVKDSLWFTIFSRSKKRVLKKPERDYADKSELLTRLKESIGKPTEGDWQIPTTEYSKITRLVSDITGYPKLQQQNNHQSKGIGFYIADFVSALSAVVVDEFPKFFSFVKQGVILFSSIIALALIPAVFGMIYRRAFMQWLVGTLIILFVINWTFDIVGVGSIGADLKEELGWRYDFYYAFIGFITFILIKTRVKRQVAGQIQKIEGQKWKAPVIATGFILVGIIWLYLISVDSLCAIPEADFSKDAVGSAVELSRSILSCDNHLSLFAKEQQGSWFWFVITQLEGVLIFWLLAWRILAQRVGLKKPFQPRQKNIVVCLDGTWNHPGQTDFGYLAQTNVFKLFETLKGEKITKHSHNANQYKEYVQSGLPPENKLDDSPTQLGFYYHGVGNKVENSQIGQVVGGAFGMGADAIVDRAYLDLIRNYRDGDRIFIFGFSRGAAIARLLASAISKRGVPTSVWTLRAFGRHWQIWKSISKLENVPINVLGCWDTVGAFGIAKNIMGIPFQQINLLKDLTIPDSVKRAYHMVALDETRDAFVPTLMDQDPIHPNRIVELWFSGNHSNIGGGYATDQLSDITLDFLLRHISSGYAYDKSTKNDDESWGIYLSAERRVKLETDRKAAADESVIIDTEQLSILKTNPNPLGKIRFSTGPVYTHKPRDLPLNAIIADEVFERMMDKDSDYAPESIFNLGKTLETRFEKNTNAIKTLLTTGTLTQKQSELIDENNKVHMKIIKWSESFCANSTLESSTINPKNELSNLQNTD